LTFFNYIDVTITIHHIDTVSVAIACSSRPIVIDANDILQLFEALTRTETHLSNKKIAIAEVMIIALQLSSYLVIESGLDSQNVVFWS